LRAEIVIDGVLDSLERLAEEADVRRGFADAGQSFVGFDVEPARTRGWDSAAWG
jgi:hypothetical protein